MTQDWGPGFHIPPALLSLATGWPLASLSAKFNKLQVMILLPSQTRKVAGSNIIMITVYLKVLKLCQQSSVVQALLN